MRGCWVGVSAQRSRRVGSVERILGALAFSSPARKTRHRSPWGAAEQRCPCAGPLGFACTKSGSECSGKKAVDCRQAGSRVLDRGIDCSGYGLGSCVMIDH